MDSSRSAPFEDVRGRGFRQRASVAQVQAEIAQRVACLPGESVSLHEAAGRVLAQDVVAEVAVPGFDRAAMDGYAVRTGDLASVPGRLKVVGQSLPGRPFEGLLQANQAVRITTGAPIPAGADAVVPVEKTQADTAEVVVLEAVASGRHISRRGEDVQPGQIVLHAGRRLRPQDVGLLASIGVARPSVVRSPRVGILITGNELLPPGSRPDGFRIVDSNSLMLAALIRRDGGNPEIPPALPDDPERLRQALAESQADAILLCGGSSVGQEDYAPSVLAALGELVFHGVAVRPAAPTGLGILSGRLVFLLPGNPVSCLCAYDLFAGRAIRRLAGRSADWPYRGVEVPLASPVTSVAGRVDYVRVRLRGGKAEPLAITGASNLSTTTQADGFFLLPDDRVELAAEERVQVWLYD
jgi:molybdopterin molybdotransferase